MRKIALVVSTAVFFVSFVACNSNKKQVSEEERQEILNTEAQVDSLEQVAKEIENAAEDLEKALENL